MSNDDRDLEQPGPDAEYPTMVYPPVDPGATDTETGTLLSDVDDDPEADAEWVVQTTRGVRLALPIAGLLAVLLVAAGFWGGVAIEKNHGGSSRGASLASLAARFRSGRTGAGGTSTTGGGGFGGLGGFSSNAAATGTVSVVDGKTLYVLTSSGSLVKVSLTTSTTITRNADSSAADLRPGDTVVVNGTTSANGNVSATSVTATASGVSASTGGGGGGGFGGGGDTSTTTTG
jgi:Domain of unknown function (DUF5666)